MKDAHDLLLLCYNELRSLGWFTRTFRPSRYEAAYRKMIDAIHYGSSWLTGRGTEEQRQALLKDQVDVEKYVLGLGYPWDHPWNRGTLPEPAHPWFRPKKR